MSEQRIRQFVDLLYPPSARSSALPEGARFSLWEMPGKRSYHYRLGDPELEIAAHALDQEGHNVFCGVGLRRDDLGPLARGSKSDIVALPGFWADVDIRGQNHVADNLPANIVDVIHGILQPFDWEPSLVVNSGGGIHAYWLFEQPLIITDENRAEVEDMSRSFQERLALGAKAKGWKWDMTADTPRVLRPVGTHNRKGSDAGREPVPVEFMGTPGGMRYPYSLFQAALKTKAGGIASILARDSSSAPIPATPDRPGQLSSPPRTIDTRTPEEILDQLRAKMRKNRKSERKEIFEHILQGEPFAGTGSRDKVLQQVASWFGFYDNSADPEILAELLEKSLAAMAAAEPAGAMTMDDAVEKISRAQADARRKSAQAHVQDEAIKAAFQRQARGLVGKINKPTELVAVPGTLPLDVLLAGVDNRGPAQLAVVANPVATGEESTTQPPPSGTYTKDEIAKFSAKQEALCGKAITFEDFKHRWIINIGDASYVFVNGKYKSPIPRINFSLSAQRDLSCLPEYIDGQYYFMPHTYNANGDKRLKTADETFRELATAARHQVADLSLAEGYYDAGTETYYEAVCPVRTDLTPLYDAQIEKWWNILAGPDSDKFLDWIATVTCLKQPSCGLFISGPPDVGKSVLANGLARLWHSGGFTRMEDVVGAFNADVAHCPLVVADETLPDMPNGKPISTKRLRDIISADTRSLRRKFVGNTALKGTIRCMFLANSERLLDLGDEVLGADSLAAVASRFLHIVAPRSASAYLNSLGGRHGGTKDWVDGDLIARHALWLRDTRKVVAAGRFWVEGHVKKMHRILASANPTSSAVLEWIVSYLTKPDKDVKAVRGVIVGNGQIWVNTTVIQQFWDKYVKTKAGAPGIKRIASALEGLLADDGGSNEAAGGRRFRMHSGEQRRYWGLRAADVIAFAEQVGIGDPELMQEQIDAVREEETK